MFDNFQKHLRSRVEISAGEMDLILSRINVRQFKKKTIIVKAGEVCRFQGYIDKGCIRMFYTDEKAHEHVVYFGFEDWWMGDISSFITGQPADYSIEALEDTIVFFFDRDDMEWLYSKVPQLERSFRILVQGALISLQKRLVASMSSNAEVRYSQLLQRFPHIELRVAQHHLASYLGITPEALSRVKKSMIEKEKKH